MKKTLVAALLGAFLFSSTSCGTVRRAAKDALITVGSPVVILYGAGTDGAADARNIQKGLEAGDGVSVLAFPFTFLYRAVDHGLSCLLHAGDLLVSPIYGIAELGGHPDTEIKPLMIYKGTWLDEEEEADKDSAASK